ncbi:MAG TPA: FAD-dependent oxidoreductase [Candidatus Sulfomarinibacteraceae bacterium]|nr:FAD-dependent oxidoreductase [Candidatus Sulfomarinibacteraceae bacterium]
MSHTLSGDRTHSAAGKAIDPQETFAFTFDGKTYQAHPGDTIGSALARAGVRVLSRSFKYHRPRGLMCCAGHCPNCLVQVADEPNVRACRRAVEPDMAVRSQNAWPSLQRDVMSLTALGDRFMPPGFYYKAFIRPRALWPVYEWVLRRAAGLGQVHPQTAPAPYDKQYVHADVAVAGGGPAGLSAALAAAQQGARVALFDENPTLGGHTRYSGDPISNLQSLVSDLHTHPNVTLFPDTTVLGYYEHNWLSAVSGRRLYKIRASSVVVATGAYEQPLVFDNNDLPGVMLGSGVQRLLRLYGIAPGRAAVVVTANDYGWEVAADLLQAGVAVQGVVEQRAAPTDAAGAAREALAAAGARLFDHSTVVAAKGRGEVQAAVVAPLADAKRQTTELACNLIAVSVGWAPANGLLYEAGGKIDYEQEQGEFLPQSLPPGVFAAGRVTGPASVAQQVRQGQQVGRAAAAFAAGEPQAESENVPDERQTHAGPRRTSTLVSAGDGDHANGGKRFVCFCEDVTDHDIEMSIAEGYNSIELLKRYSTISMGPCQGKMCSANTIHLCARANGWSVNETGTTTARPPATPVSLGALAGQKMEPVRRTPLHEWHVAQGAKMMTAGLWMRPEHYGDPTAEVRAVRQRVGLIDVSTLGKLRLTGPGVPALLERLYANRWQKLGVGRVRYGLMCNDEGIVLDDGVTARLGEEEYYMTTTSSGAGAVYEWIEWWVQSGWGQGARVTPLTDAFAAFNLAGPRARTVLARLAGGDLSNEAFPYMHVRQMDVAGAPCRLLRLGFTGELSYEIHCPAGYGPHLWQALMEAGADEGIAPFGVEAQRVLRLEKAHLIIGQDTDALSDPFGAGLGWAVKMDKDDFLGRRSLLRVADNSPAQRLCGFKMCDPQLAPAEGLQVVEQTAEGLTIVGHVTSSRYSPSLEEAIGLCWLPARLADPGTKIAIRLEDGRLVEAEVCGGAFYDPEGRRLEIG